MDVTYQVSLVDTKTGERRLVDGGEPWSDMLEYMWTDGNFACDCHRHDVFYGDENGACGSSRFLAEYALLPGGERVSLDD